MIALKLVFGLCASGVLVGCLTKRFRLADVSFGLMMVVYLMLVITGW